MVIVPTDILAHSFAGFLIIAVMNPSKHARIGDIVADVPEIGVLENDPWRTWMRQCDRIMTTVSPRYVRRTSHLNTTLLIIASNVG